MDSLKDTTQLQVQIDLELPETKRSRGRPLIGGPISQEALRKPNCLMRQPKTLSWRRKVRRPDLK